MKLNDEIHRDWWCGCLLLYGIGQKPFSSLNGHLDIIRLLKYSTILKVIRSLQKYYNTLWVQAWLLGGCG